MLTQTMEKVLAATFVKSFKANDLFKLFKQALDKILVETLVNHV